MTEEGLRGNVEISRLMKVKGDMEEGREESLKRKGGRKERTKVHMKTGRMEKVREDVNS